MTRTLWPPAAFGMAAIVAVIAAGDTNHIPSANRPGGMTILDAATHTCGRLLAQQTGGQQ